MKRNVTWLGWVAGLAALGVTLALAACGGAQPALAGTQWNLAALNGQAPVAGFDRLALKFESDSQVSGNSGCNSFGGSYTATGGALRFGPLAGTLRACAEQALNDQEARYYTALSNTAAFELAGGRLLFKDASGATVLVFDPA